MCCFKLIYIVLWHYMMWCVVLIYVFYIVSYCFVLIGVILWYFVLFCVVIYCRFFILIYFLALWSTLCRHWDGRITFIDEDPSINYLYFLHWKNSAGTENVFGILEQLDSNILVHSLRRMCSDDNWRHSEAFEQSAIASLAIPL